MPPSIAGLWQLRKSYYYLPTVERLTGIAVLSRLPIVQAEGRLITSQQEQTGIVHTQLAAAGRDLHVYSTWLGIRGEDTQRQISKVIGIIGANSPTVLGGAFNTEPGSSAYAAINAAALTLPRSAWTRRHRTFSRATLSRTPTMSGGAD
jgi:endonuclease/exonuclease/phosphatase family metal-dependent hydrolase